VTSVADRERPRCAADEAEGEPEAEQPRPIKSDEVLGYADAVAELNEILVSLEDDDLDIDELGDRVERAATLIALCRDRIDAARLRVTEVVATLEPDDTAT
jgi:exodeoxyribonuclease VII small subunit